MHTSPSPFRIRRAASHVCDRPKGVHEDFCNSRMIENSFVTRIMRQLDQLIESSNGGLQWLEVRRKIA